uniref:Uncharacterized protein n=1 Tax=Arundo donax TaxID=35708 RepID=A0A0A9BMC8_ARUDO
MYSIITSKVVYFIDPQFLSLSLFFTLHIYENIL